MIWVSGLAATRAKAFIFWAAIVNAGQFFFKQAKRALALDETFSAVSIAATLTYSKRLHREPHCS